MKTVFDLLPKRALRGFTFETPDLYCYADNPAYAADDISSVMHPRVKVEWGADGTATDTSLAAPMPVTNQVETGYVAAAGVQRTPVYLAISASSSATTTLVAAQASAKFRVLNYMVVGDATTTCQFKSSVTPITGVMVFQPGAVAPFSEVGWFETEVGQPLTFTAGDKKVGGSLVYIAVSV